MSSLSLSTTNPERRRDHRHHAGPAGRYGHVPGDRDRPDRRHSVSRSFTVTAGSYAANAELEPCHRLQAVRQRGHGDRGRGRLDDRHRDGPERLSRHRRTQYFNPTYSYTVVEQPSHGKLTLTSSSTTTPTAAFTYTPDPGYSGPDSFQFTITEDGPTPFLGSNQNTGTLYFGPAEPTTSNPAAVTITVTPTPTPTTPSPRRPPDPHRPAERRPRRRPRRPRRTTHADLDAHAARYRPRSLP